MPSTFSLVDDGTLDTVVRCILCDVELRYSGIEFEVEDGDDDDRSDRRIEAALAMAADDHVCGDDGNTAEGS